MSTSVTSVVLAGVVDTVIFLLHPVLSARINSGTGREEREASRYS
jgi:hypothetical protein